MTNILLKGLKIYKKFIPIKKKEREARNDQRKCQRWREQPRQELNKNGYWIQDKLIPVEHSWKDACDHKYKKKITFFNEKK